MNMKYTIFRSFYTRILCFILVSFWLIQFYGQVLKCELLISLKGHPMAAAILCCSLLLHGPKFIAKRALFMSQKELKLVYKLAKSDVIIGAGLSLFCKAKLG